MFILEKWVYSTTLSDKSNLPQIPVWSVAFRHVDKHADICVMCHRRDPCEVELTQCCAVNDDFSLFVWTNEDGSKIDQEQDYSHNTITHFSFSKLFSHYYTAVWNTSFWLVSSEILRFPHPSPSRRESSWPL